MVGVWAVASVRPRRLAVQVQSDGPIFHWINYVVNLIYFAEGANDREGENVSIGKRIAYNTHACVQCCACSDNVVQYGDSGWAKKWCFSTQFNRLIMVTGRGAFARRSECRLRHARRTPQPVTLPPQPVLFQFGCKISNRPDTTIATTDWSVSRDRNDYHLGAKEVTKQSLLPATGYVPGYSLRQTTASILESIDGHASGPSRLLVVVFAWRAWTIDKQRSKSDDVRRQAIQRLGPGKACDQLPDPKCLPLALWHRI